MSFTVRDWERLRAQQVADLMRQIVTEGVSGGDSIDPLIGSLPPGGDANVRLAAYGMLGALSVVEPYRKISDVGTFFNSWGDVSPSDQPFSVFKDPFGGVHWSGLPGRLSGTASNGELICRFPLEYAPNHAIGFPCITNSGLAHIGIFSDGTMTWRTTGGFSGGYAFFYADNIGAYYVR